METFFKFTTWDPYPYAGKPGAALGSSGPTKKAPGPGPMGRPGPGHEHPGSAASFVVPGDPKAAPGSPAYEYGSQVANLKNLPVVYLTGRITQGNKVDLAIYIYMDLKRLQALGDVVESSRRVCFSERLTSHRNFRHAF
jgi:hypothetical protein